MTAGYFVAFRVPVLEGRGFTAADVAGSQPVAVVNERFARKFLAGAISQSEIDMESSAVRMLLHRFLIEPERVVIAARLHQSDPQIHGGILRLGIDLAGAIFG